MTKGTFQFIIILILFPFISCKKDNTVNPTSVQVYMKYKLDGVLQDYTGDVGSLVSTGTGVTASKDPVPNSSNKVYMLWGQKSSEHVLTFNFPTDSLQVGQYKFDHQIGFQSMCELKIVNSSVTHRYTLRFDRGDVMTTNITRYSNGSIDGTFSGRLTYYDFITYTSVNITEGEFKNVPIYYH